MDFSPEEAEEISPELLAAIALIKDKRGDRKIIIAAIGYRVLAVAPIRDMHGLRRATRNV